jgi:hypothetical protein
MRLTRWSGISSPGSGGTSRASARNALRSSGEAFPAFKEVCRGLDRAGLLRDRGCNRTGSAYLVFLTRRAVAALIEAGSFRGLTNYDRDRRERPGRRAVTCNPPFRAGGGAISPAAGSARTLGGINWIVHPCIGRGTVVALYAPDTWPIRAHDENSAAENGLRRSVRSPGARLQISRLTEIFRTL